MTSEPGFTVLAGILFLLLAVGIAAGFAEAVRVTQRGGLIFAKGGSGIDGAKLFRTDAIIEQCADYDSRVEVIAKLVFPTVPCRAAKLTADRKSRSAQTIQLCLFAGGHHDHKTRITDR